MRKYIVVMILISTLFACKHKSEEKGTIEKYEVTFSSNENRAIEAEIDGKTFAGGMVEKGKEIIFTAIPYGAFFVKEWSGAQQDKKQLRRASLVVNEKTHVSVTFTAIEGMKTVVNAGESLTIEYGNVENGKWQIHYLGREVTTSFKLLPYAIATEELTFKLWNEVYTWTIKNGYKFANEGVKGDDRSSTGYNPNNHTDDEPVTMISWRDVVVWCNAYTEKTFGEKECVYYNAWNEPMKDATVEIEKKIDIETMKDKLGFKLPSEPEWEVVARGGDPKSPNWKLKFAGSNDINEVCWYEGNSTGGTHKANDEKKPNTLRIYNMCGNVGDRVQVDKKPNYVTRGGSYIESEKFCAISFRGKNKNMELKHGSYGMRLAMSYIKEK